MDELEAMSRNYLSGAKVATRPDRHEAIKEIGLMRWCLDAIEKG